MSKRQREVESFSVAYASRDYEVMRVRRVQPTPPAPTAPVNVPNPEINIHIENIFEVHDVVTPHHTIRVNDAEVVDLQAGVVESPSLPRMITVLLPAVEVVIQYPMTTFERQTNIRCITVQYSCEEPSDSEPSSPSDASVD